MKRYIGEFFLFAKAFLHNYFSHKKQRNRKEVLNSKDIFFLSVCAAQNDANQKIINRKKDPKIHSPAMDSYAPIKITEIQK